MIVVYQADTEEIRGCLAELWPNIKPYGTQLQGRKSQGDRGIAVGDLMFLGIQDFNFAQI